MQQTKTRPPGRAGMEAELRATCAALERQAQELRVSHLALEKTAAALRASQRRLREQARRDPLTGLLNRMGFTRQVRPLFAKARRRGEPIGLLVIDIDRFKRINDRTGHAEGDSILKNCARRLLSAVPDRNTACRYGGDEFLVALPNHDALQTRNTADQVRRAFSSRTVRGETGQRRVTVSVGASCTEASRNFSLDRLLRKADQALYRAKRDGRNRVAFVGDRGGSTKQTTGAKPACFKPVR